MPRNVQWVIPSLMYQTRKKINLYTKGYFVVKRLHFAIINSPVIPGPKHDWVLPEFKYILVFNYKSKTPGWLGQIKLM